MIGEADKLILPEFLWENDDSAALQQALDAWKQPKADELLALLDQAAELPRTTACLLQFLHSHFMPAELDAARQRRQDMDFGLLDMEEEDWALQFGWEETGAGCRLTECRSADREVLIPETVGGLPVTEIAQRFFLTCPELELLLVPQEISIGTILPQEAGALFGAEPVSPVIERLERESGPLQPAEDELPVLPETIWKAQTGETVEFGSYVMRPSGGKEPLLWRVARREQERLLLVAEQLPERLPFHSASGRVSWAGCELRRWLNDVFLRAAFSRTEQAMLLTVKLESEPNPLYHTPAGETTEDRIFVLTAGEYLSLGLDKTTPKGTPWSERNSRRFGGGITPCRVWTRTPGLTEQYAVSVDEKTGMFYHGDLVEENQGIRPALWLQI